MSDAPAPLAADAPAPAPDAAAAPAAADAPAQAPAQGSGGEARADASSSDDDAAVKYTHRRRPSWLSDSHPSFVWGDDDTRKKILADMHRQASDAAQLAADADAGGADDASSDADEEDMAYGLDPGFATLDEELRVVEGMITEHTTLKEVEVDDDDDDDGSSSSDEDSSAETTTGSEAASEPAGQTASSQPPDGAAQQGLPHAALAAEAELFAGVAVAQPLVVETVGGGEAAASAASPSDAASPAAKPASASPAHERRRRTHKSHRHHTAAGPAASAGAAAAAAPGARAGHPRRRVRVVELPDYLAMLAREHRRQLLDKQRRDLALAAEARAAKAAEAAGGSPGAAAGARGARSELTIRRGYLERLGIGADTAPAAAAPDLLPPALRGLDMGIYARRAALASARTRSKPPAMRVPLRDASTPAKGKGFFRKLAQWMGGDETGGGSGGAGGSSAAGGGGAGASPGEGGGRARSGSATGSASGSVAAGAGAGRIVFKESADVFLIPARTDYPARVRNAIWHTRAEFMDMVMTNMDEVELEMHQAAEAQRRLQDLRDNPPPAMRKQAPPQPDPDAVAASGKQ